MDKNEKNIRLIDVSVKITKKIECLLAEELDKELSTYLPIIKSDLVVIAQSIGLALMRRINEMLAVHTGDDVSHLEKVMIDALSMANKHTSSCN